VTIRRVELSGMRSAAVCEVFLDDAEAPAEHLLGERGRGFHLLRASLAVERLLAAGVSLGLSTAAFELALRYCGEREAFGRPIGAFQAVQHPLVDSATELAGSLLLAERAAEVLESGADATGIAAMAKLGAAETAVRVVDRGMRAMAAHGYAASSPMQMYFRDARLQTFSPISNEMIRNLLAEQMGMPRSY
jgi:alkylation response protein AidB-like acyl-CoA dehydrogenase